MSTRGFTASSILLFSSHNWHSYQYMNATHRKIFMQLLRPNYSWTLTDLAGSRQSIVKTRTCVAGWSICHKNILGISYNHPTSPPTHISTWSNVSEWLWTFAPILPQLYKQNFMYMSRAFCRSAPSADGSDPITNRQMGRPSADGPPIGWWVWPNSW